MKKTFLYLFFIGIVFSNILLGGSRVSIGQGDSDYKLKEKSSVVVNTEIFYVSDEAQARFDSIEQLLKEGSMKRALAEARQFYLESRAIYNGASLLNKNKNIINTEYAMSLISYGKVLKIYGEDQTAHNMHLNAYQLFKNYDLRNENIAFVLAAESIFDALMKEGKTKEAASFINSVLLTSSKLFKGKEINSKIILCFAKLVGARPLMNDRDVIKYYQDAFSAYEKSNGKDSKEYAGVFIAIADRYHNNNRLKHALADIEQALVVLNNNFSTQYPDHIYFGEVVELKGNVLFGLSQYENATIEFKKAIRIKKKALGDKNIAVANSKKLLAISQKYQGLYDDAIKNALMAKNIIEELYGEENKKSVDFYSVLAGIYYEKGEYQQAIESFKTAYDVSVKNFGRENTFTKILASNIKFIEREKASREW